MFPVEAVCVEVLQKGLSEIGRLWYENRASVQQEHFASGLAMRRLDALLSATPAPTRNATILVGCAPDEWHVFTPLLLSLLLRRRGSNVIFLGANVPTTRFADTIKKVKATYQRGYTTTDCTCTRQPEHPHCVRRKNIQPACTTPR